MVPRDAVLRPVATGAALEVVNEGYRRRVVPCPVVTGNIVPPDSGLYPVAVCHLPEPDDGVRVEAKEKAFVHRLAEAVAHHLPVEANEEAIIHFLAEGRRASPRRRHRTSFPRHDRVDDDPSDVLARLGSLALMYDLKLECFFPIALFKVVRKQSRCWGSRKFSVVIM